MPLTTLILATPGTLPGGSAYCLTTFQKLVNDIFDTAQWTFQSDVGNSFFNYGSTIPTVDNQIFPWRRVGTSKDGWYDFDNGEWIMQHLSDASGAERRLWVGIESDLVTYDGGDADPPDGHSHGPMWQVDHDFDGRIPMGPGTLPVAGVLAPDANLGAETQTLVAAQLPAHKHLESGFYTPSQICYDPSNGTVAVAGSGKGVDGTGGNHSDRVQTYTGPGDGTGAAFNILPPVRGAFMIGRTARTHYRA